MAKVRVYQLAKELQVQSALILELLDRLGHEIKSDLSVLDGGTADLVRKRVTVAIAEARKNLEQEEQLARAQSEATTPAPTPVVAELGERTIAVKDPEPTEETPEVSRPAAAAAATTTPAAVPTPPAAPSPVAAAPAAPAARTPAAPPAATPAAAAGATPGADGAPRKPRVFPARRLVPHPSVRPAPPRPVRPAAPAFQPGGMQRPGSPPPRPGMPPAGPRPKRRKKQREKTVVQAPARPKADLPPVPEKITLSEAVTVKELAEKLNRKSKDVIAKLISRGVLATINQPLDPEMAIDVAKEFGSEANVITFEEEVHGAAPAGAEADAAEEAPATDAPGQLVVRPPVVTVMGHVDHGKTSLLDAIRSTEVADGEAGGITQHIGAYQVREKGRTITFIDTPGHEAFTMMRARGSKVTDIVVLVVAADDGVKPQTREAIDHARAAGVPMVVAINKIDKPNALPDRVKQQLAEIEVVIEEYGGEVVACEISAKKREGINELLDMILLVADMTELKANPDRLGMGVVLETRLDRSRGVVSTVLVQNGTLRVGDPFISGSVSGKIRAMTDEHGHRMTEAGPATPVEVIGFAGEASAGDSFQAVTHEAKARQIAAFRYEKQRAERQLSSARQSLETLAAAVKDGEVKELPFILKCDTHGSSEALQKSLGDLPTDKIRVRVIRSSFGAITQADVLLASASNAIIIGFNVRPDRTTAELAKQEGIEIRLYAVIYNVLDDVRQAMIGLLEPTLKEVVLGQAEVRQLFKVPKMGTIAGTYVSNGKVTRSAEVRLLRDHVVIYTGKVGSLRRFKDDVSEVKQGYECGIGIANYNDLKEGDIIEFFATESIAAESL